MSERKYITTVLFDLDGVIIDSNKAIVRSWRAAAKQYGYVVDDDMVRKFIIGASPEYTLDNLFPKESQVTKRVIHRLVNKMEEEEDCPLIPGVDVLLNALCHFDLNLGIVTSSWPRKISHVLRGNNFNMFSYIVSRDDVCHGKPSPEPYLRAIEHFNSHPKETLVFEDSLHGIASAIGAGAKCIAIGNDIGSDCVIPKVADFRYLNVTNNEPDYSFYKTDFGIRILKFSH